MGSPTIYSIVSIVIAISSVIVSIVNLCTIKNFKRRDERSELDRDLEHILNIASNIHTLNNSILPRHGLLKKFQLMKNMQDMIYFATEYITFYTKHMNTLTKTNPK